MECLAKTLTEENKEQREHMQQQQDHIQQQQELMQQQQQRELMQFDAKHKFTQRHYTLARYF